MINEFINTIKCHLNKMVGTYETMTPIVEIYLKECIEKEFPDAEIVKNANGNYIVIVGEYYFLLDIKRQDINKTYSFPNMISISKARDILKDDNKNIIYIFVERETSVPGDRIDRIKVQRIETLNWDYLYIQNLGKGQLQIKNMPRCEFIFKNDVTRKEWLKELITKGSEYYNNLMLKVVEYKTEWENESVDN